MRITIRKPDAGTEEKHVMVVGEGGALRVVDSTAGAEPLDPEGALDDEGCLSKCCVCGCDEFFVRKDFPQRLGLVMVVAVALASVTLFALRRIVLAVAVLAGLVIVDIVLNFLVGRCVVCYRCRAEYRDLPIDARVRPWSLATGEKYRTGEDMPFES